MGSVGWGRGGVPAPAVTKLRSLHKTRTFNVSELPDDGLPRIPYERFRSTKTMFPETPNAQALHS